MDECVKNGYVYIGKVKRENTGFFLFFLFISISRKLFVHRSFFSFSLQVILVFVLSIGSLVIYFINSSE